MTSRILKAVSAPLTAKPGVRATHSIRQPDATIQREPVRQVFISQSSDVFTNLALEDWLYRNHDFEHKVSESLKLSCKANGNYILETWA